MESVAKLMDAAMREYSGVVQSTKDADMIKGFGEFRKAILTVITPALTGKAMVEHDIKQFS